MPHPNWHVFRFCTPPKKSKPIKKNCFVMESFINNVADKALCYNHRITYFKPWILTVTF